MDSQIKHKFYFGFEIDLNLEACKGWTNSALKIDIDACGYCNFKNKLSILVCRMSFFVQATYKEY